MPHIPRLIGISRGWGVHVSQKLGCISLIISKTRSCYWHHSQGQSRNFIAQTRNTGFETDRLCNEASCPRCSVFARNDTAHVKPHPGFALIPFSLIYCLWCFDAVVQQNATRGHHFGPKSSIDHIWFLPENLLWAWAPGIFRLHVLLEAVVEASCTSFKCFRYIYLYIYIFFTFIDVVR